MINLRVLEKGMTSRLNPPGVAKRYSGPLRGRKAFSFTPSGALRRIVRQPVFCAARH